MNLEKYGIDLSESTLLPIALTHSSYAYEHNLVSYERLEFLGDAVLELISSNYIYKNGNYTEGQMTVKRKSYVCENALFEYAKELELSKYIKMGNGTKMPSKSVIADVLEAIIAVIYLEQGLDKATEFFNKLIVPYIQAGADFLHDYKSSFQEMMQTDRNTITYNIIKEGGPAHKKYFIAEVRVNDIVYGTGKGNTRQEAQQMAAKEAINKGANDVY